LVLVDCGVRHKHYCSDLTRCFLLKKDRKRERQYESLQDICYSIVDGLPSLRTGKEVSALADRLIKKAGFPRMIHTIGHGVGLDVHELPNLSVKSEDGIAGATMAIEPAFYLGSHGMRYEETIFFDGKKARIL
jgi:Xaa-Pro aminopeptidase